MCARPVARAAWNDATAPRVKLPVVAARIAGLIAFSLLAAGPRAADAGDWEIILDRDGIVVSRRSVEGQDLPQLRAVAEVPGTPYEVLAVLLDVQQHVAWSPDCVESRIVQRLSQWRSRAYTRIHTPWPLADREVVVENDVFFIEPPSKLKVTFRSVAAPEVERRRHVIRMPRVSGFYAIEATGDGRSRVHYELDADPGGNLPDLFISLQSSRNPFRTLTGIRRQLERTRGQYDQQIERFPQAVPRG
jgi:hypothetical protein